MTLPTSPIGHGDHVLIVGAGFSGTLLAINLLRHQGPRATLVERRPHQMARGVAYSAADDSHLLNVRAANMSALPDDPDHFVRWLAARGEGSATSFVQRTRYGRYLGELLAGAQAAAPDRLTIVNASVDRIEDRPDGVTAYLADGGSIHADRAVLAVGNLPPHAPPGIDPQLLPPDIYCDDPWAADIADGLAPKDEVLLLGTGLTAVDAALLLQARGFTGRILAVSRRGLRPRAHVADQPRPAPLHEKPARELSALTRSVRTAAASADWRGAVDALRPVTQMMWAGADLAVRKRFLRHLRPFWDVHRHRLAPEIADRIEAMTVSGQLRFAAGRTLGARAEPRSIAVDLRWRGSDQAQTRRFRRIVNCTGPQGDLLRSTDPLLRDLLDQGMIRPDAARLGIDIAADTRTIRQDGTPHPHLHAIGPMTRGAYWEVVAVPDIRVQCWNLARALANAH